MPDKFKIINIDSLSYGGWGVGRADSKVVFVAYAVPGDNLKIEILEEHKNYDFAVINKIIKPSDERIEPVCKYFGICGGCDYLCISYNTEIYWKTEIFKKEFKKNFGSNYFKQDVPIKFNPAKANLNYRQKIGLKIHNKNIGFYKKYSNDIVNIEQCRLAKDSLNELLKKAVDILFSEKYYMTVTKNISMLTISEAGFENIIIRVKNNFRLPEQFVKDIFTGTKCDNIFLESPDKKIIKYADEGTDKNNNKKFLTIKDKKFLYDLPSFIQINKEQNENIINAISDYIEAVTERGVKKFSNALDLYCGFGNITLFLTSYAEKIIGVESGDFAVELGKKNAAINNMKNINFIKSDVSKFFDKIEKDKKFDLIILDPPRSGVKGLTNKITDLNPLYIIYVSCDTMTFLRDLRQFAETGYEIEKIDLFDMFPRTYHLEQIAFLKKNRQA
ncbi:MAG: 23S rRNA (uracil(1939)-C(5))-methyltransferase RlmD [Deltaproteobacteria bacterium]|nr:23S rRNA (uracil(1939)-C(5))-methyltransferase RlmD [Deltaproteobacteria bacterium]